MTPKLVTEGFIAQTKDLLAKITRVPRAIIADGKECEPVLLVFPKDKAIPVAAIPVGPFFASNMGKDIVARVHCKAAAMPTTLVAVLITETWMVMQPKDDRTIAEAMEKSIADHPDRTEGVMFSFINGEGEQLIAMYPIDRATNTLSAEPQMIVDPLQGEVEGPNKGKRGGAIGRMMLEPDVKQ